MAQYTQFIILSIIKLAFCKECVIDNNSPGSSWEHQLRDDIFRKCVYDYRKPPPVNATETLKVNVTFILKNFDFQNDEEIFVVYNWVYLTWIDRRLTWKPESYGGIDQILVTSLRIWTPGLRHHNSADASKWDFLYCICSIRNTGLVKCRTIESYQTECVTKLSNWPYDRQNCTLHFGEWNRPYVNTQFNFLYTVIDLELFGTKAGTRWNIADLDTKGNPNKTEQFSLNFYVQRQAAGLIATIVVPSVIVCVLTVVSFVLSIDRTRIYMLCFSLLLHYWILTLLSDFIPHHSRDAPSILLFIRTSMMLTVFSILFTYFLAYLKTVEKPTPLRINSLNTNVKNSRLKHIIWPKWQLLNINRTSETFDESRTNEEDWYYFANILNTGFFAIVIIIYVSILGCYMPRLPPKMLF